MADEVELLRQKVEKLEARFQNVLLPAIAKIKDRIDDLESDVDALKDEEDD